MRLVPSLAYFDTPRDALSSKTVRAGWVAGSPQLDYAELPEALPVARGLEPLRFGRLLMSKRTASAIFMCTTGQRRTFSVGNIVGDFSIFFGKEKSKKKHKHVDGWMELTGKCDDKIPAEGID